MNNEEKLVRQGFLVDKKEYERSKIHIPISGINEQMQEHINKMTKQFDEDVVLELSKTYDIKGTAQEIAEMISNLKKELQKSKEDINNLKHMLEESYKTIDRQLDYIFRLKSGLVKKYKLTKNEVLELKYMQNIGYTDLRTDECFPPYFKLQAHRKSGHTHTHERLFYDYKHLEKSKEYSIEEILNNYEVIE